MELFRVLAALVTLAALFAYLNHRTLRVPTTIGVMVIARLFSLALLGLGKLGLGGESWFAWFHEVRFGPTLLQGMLGYLLFAGALHVNLDDLLDRKWTIGLLATAGVLLSTAMVGGLAYYGDALVGL